MDEKYKKYPFLDGIEQELAKEGITIEDVLNGKHEDIDERLSRIYALKYINKAVKSDSIEIDVPRHRVSTDLMNEFAGYVLARIIISSVNDSVLIQKFASSQAESFLNRSNKEIPEVLLNEFNINIDKIDEHTYSVHYSSYVNSVPSYNSKWKLASQEFDNGYVNLGKEELRDMLKYRINQSILGSLPVSVPQSIEKELEEEIEKVSEAVNKRTNVSNSNAIGDIHFNSMPEIIKDIEKLVIEKLNNGSINEIKYELFVIVSFYNRLGMEEEKINKRLNENNNKAVETYINRIVSINAEPPTYDTLKYKNIVEETESIDGYNDIVSHYKSLYSQ